MNANNHDDVPNAEPGIPRGNPMQHPKIPWLIAGLIVAAILLCLFVLPTLKDWMHAGNPSVVAHRMILLCYAMSALLFAIAVGAAWHARRIFRASQYPPPSKWMPHDARSLRGDAARARGRWVLACAIGFALLAIYAATLPHQIDAQLAKQPAAHIIQTVVPHG